MADNDTEDPKILGQNFIKQLFNKIKNLIAINSKPQDLRESLEDLADNIKQEEAPLSAEEQKLFSNIISLRHCKVDEIKIPRTDIIAISNNSTLKNIRDLVVENQISRIPIYDDNLDHITGFVHIKDAVRYIEEENLTFDIKDIERKILFAPPVMPASELLLQMRNSGIHIAIVVDEYGGTQGLICLEDIIEFLIGDIQDEHDVEEDFNEDDVITETADGLIEVSGRCTLEKLNKYLGMQLAEDDNEDFDTIAGLVSFIAGKIPEVGEEVVHPSNLKFKVLESDSRKIDKILIIKT